MTKDYAKRKRATKKTNTRTPKTKTKKPISPVIVFISGILLTLFAVFLWAIVKKPEVINELVSNDDKQQNVSTEPPKDKAEKAETGNKQNSSQKDTEFTYHETLTNKKVDVEVTRPKQSDTNKSYIMQCGAFKKLPDAEKMKAELAFIGFQAKILTKGGWHRVRLGPYQSKRTAESDRHKLQDNNYLNCQIW
jgi:cell division protein FtsN